jgi:amino acid adenylation domain-containing protein
VDFKVPRQIAIVESIPVGPSGKLQRLNLAAMLGLNAVDQALTIATHSFEAPKTELECRLGDIWARLLRVEKVGRQDNFFQLGGDSLLAAQILARVRNSFAVDVSFIDFFETPTVAGLALAIEGATKTARVPQGLSPRPSSAMDTFPLSYAQQSLWVVEQLNPESPANNRPAALCLSGSLDVAAMEKSLNQIVSRHEALRTTYRVIGDTPMQLIQAPRPVSLPLCDLSVIPVEDRETRAREIAVDEAWRPFDLAHGPMLRVTLVKLDQQDHLLIVVMHHIASDGWSSELFFRELAICYNGFSNGLPPDLPPLPVQYRDYALWQRESLQGQDFENLLSYWKQQIGPELPRLRFPNTLAAARTLPSRRGATQVLKVSTRLADALRTFSQANNATLFMTLLAAFKTLLYRYTGQQDVMIGVPVAGRTSEQLEEVIGDFINILPLRSDLSGNPSFRSLLDRVRNMILQAYAHQDLPVAKLAEALRVERRINLNAALQVIFNLRNYPSRTVPFAGLSVVPLELDYGIARFDLALEIAETPHGLSGIFEYDTGIFDRETILHLMCSFQTMLEGIVANPHQLIDSLPLPAAAVKRQAARNGSAGADNTVPKQTVHGLFEVQAARKPTAIAVAHDGNGLSYGGLNRRANQLAHYLRSRGVGPETLVGLCVERSVEMAIGILGILKAGGAYVPLDPRYPRERLAFMLRDCGATVVLSQQRLVSMLPSHSGEVVLLDRDRQEIAQQSETNPEGLCSAEHLAYVIYTSGSTGQPKGVLVTHSGLVNHSIAVAELFALQSTDRVSQCNSLSFDISVEELFSSWISGAAVVLCPAEKFLPDAEFARWLADEEITVLNLPTAFWHEWVCALESAPTPVAEFLRLIVVGGDKALPHILARWGSMAAAQVSWINTYGPTEATVTTTACVGRSGMISEGWHATIPIGRPIAGAEVYLLDDKLNLVSIGVPGELYIGGRGLARGYRNRPELTSERFIPHPFAAEPGRRLYRTGDICRYLPDGNLEFLGRTDHQVKIRGFRIELDEIESVLTEHPAVRESMVIAHEAEGGEFPSRTQEKRLIAYVVGEPAATVTISELRSFVKEKLPEYMVPSAFMLMDSLPLTANGKLDRQALPAPDSCRIEQDELVSLPRTPAEEMLAGIWAEVLKLSTIGIHQNFFDIGGHSLLATQVVSRLNQAFRVDLPLRTLFEAPTVVGLAERVQAIRNKARGLPTCPILSVPREEGLPLSFAQQRLWFLHQLEPKSSVYNVPIAYRLKGPLDIRALERSLTEILGRHEVLRTTFSVSGSGPVQKISPPLRVTLPLTDLSHLSGEDGEAEVRRLVRQEADRAFDLERGPLARGALLRLGTEHHVFLLTVHHIAFDGWSLGVLLRELSTIYEAVCDGKPSKLEELPFQYRDFAQWQREWLEGGVLETQLGYWKKQLENIQTLQLPTDRPRPAVQSYRGASQSMVLSKELTDQLKTLSRQQSVTLFMTLLAAFQTLLHRYTGQDDVAVGSPIANRNRVEIEGLIGFFVNTLVFRTDLSGRPKFTDLLKRVREISLEAYAHQDPFREACGGN